jgi:hypothetical protein
MQGFEPLAQRIDLRKGEAALGRGRRVNSSRGRLTAIDRDGPATWLICRVDRDRDVSNRGSQSLAILMRFSW